MKYVFGPVPSRRLGRSLGIDPIPFKTCNWNCVYCQLGRTSPLARDRHDHCPAAEVVAEVKTALRRHPPDSIDWLTFVGSGEPTLHAELGVMLESVKSMTTIPVAVITNGSLLHLPDVRKELLVADAVLPTLDAGSDALYRRINRPLADLSWDRLVTGLIDFRAQFRGKLWIEIMLIKGLNDSPSALTDLAAVLRQIQPDEVHLNLPVRPPCEPWVEPADRAGLSRATSILGDVARVVRPAGTHLQLTDTEDVAASVLAVITRHPMPEDELLQTLGGSTPDQILEALDELRRGGRAQAIERHGQRFWSSAEARYVDDPLHRCCSGSAPPFNPKPQA